MNEHLIIEYNEKFNFNKVTCPEGHYITNWDKQDIREYTASKIMFCPTSLDLSNYYCLTEEEHNELMEKQEEEIMKEEEMRP